MDTMRTRTIIDEIVRELSGEILSGHLEPGDRLPSYRSLNERFDVTMPTTQRAMAKLEEMGLVRIRQGSGAVVLEPLLSAHPGVLPYWLDALRDAPLRARHLLDDVLELRRELAARLVLRYRHRADEEQVDTVRALVEQMAVTIDRGDPLEDIVEAELAIIGDMLRVADQLAIATIFNAFARMVRTLPMLQTAMYSSPSHNVDAWNDALLMIDADATVTDDAVEQTVRETLAAIDEHTIVQFTRMLENAA